MKNRRSSIFKMVLALALVSCNKTEYEFQKSPYNSITSFKIGGYTGLDSILAIIKNDSILVYWSSEVEKPDYIQPIITFSKKATVYPGSNERVLFDESTVYTITAENGTEQAYKLIPVINEPIPILTSITNPTIAFNESTGLRMNLVGQYFLPKGDTSAIRVYAQRVSDGFEFDLGIDKSYVTQTSLRVSLPEFNSSLDTGAHRIFVQVGNEHSSFLTRWIAAPRLRENVHIDFGIQDAPGTIHAGDTLTVKFKIDELVRKYYHDKIEGGITFALYQTGNTNYKEVNAEWFEVDGDYIRVAVPNGITAFPNFEFFRLIIKIPYNQSGDGGSLQFHYMNLSERIKIAGN